MQEFLRKPHSRVRAYNASIALHLCLTSHASGARAVSTNERMDDSALRERRQYGLDRAFATANVPTMTRGPLVDELVAMHEG